MFTHVLALYTVASAEGCYALAGILFASADVGNGKVVNVAGYAMSGAERWLAVHERGDFRRSIGFRSRDSCDRDHRGNCGSAKAERVATTTEGIPVSLIRTPSTQQSGEVAVSVPQQIAQDARGFGFALPAALLTSAAAQGNEVKAAGLDSRPFPAWIHYEAQTGSFTVSNPPAGALQLRTSLTIGSQP